MTFSDLESVLAHWTGLAGAQAILVNLSENHTFRLDVPDGGRFILRVHRPFYHSRAAIESELAWMRALRAETGLFTPRPLAGRDGQWVQEVPFTSADDRRYMVLFAFETGIEPAPEDDLAPIFSQLGALAAQCHTHVFGWERPDWFTRQRWTTRTILDPDAIWGDWRAAPGVEGEVRTVLDRLDRHLRTRLERYGTDAERFGLIHADMRLANLLVEGGETRLIDFDDSGFGWFGYDFAAGVSFFEDDPQVPELRSAWVEGYRRHRMLTNEDEAMLGDFVMLRRMALRAWIGSHAEVDLAREMAPRFAPVTAELAERHISGGLFAP